MKLQSAISFVTLGTSVFAPSKAALLDTLFNPVDGGTASGYFTKHKDGVSFYKPDGALFAFLVCNRHGERFMVSAFKDDKGRTVYMQALSTLDEARLGFSSLSWSEQHDEAGRIAKELGF